MQRGTSITSRPQSEAELERLAQLQYGRKKLTLPSTSFSNSTKNKPMNTVGSKQVQIQTPKKIQKVGHEACLAKVVSERRQIEILFADGTTAKGELFEFDKFSIRIKHADGTYMWYFKGSMKGFSEIAQ